MTCEFYVRYSHDPAKRQVCGAEARRVLVIQHPQRHNVAGEDRIPLCQAHYESESKVLVTG